MVRFCVTGLTLAGLSLAQAHSNTSLANAIYKDASQSVDARVENLLSLMTLEEKMAQLMQGTKTHTHSFYKLADRLF